VGEDTFEEKLELLHAGYQAANDNDQEAYLRLQHPEIVVHDESRPDLSSPDGRYRGHGGVRRYWNDWMESFDEFEIDPEDFIDASPGVVVRVRARARARASGIEVENRRFHAFRFREGKVSFWGVYEDKEEAIRAARPAPQTPPGERRRPG
jgi:ketosteroid isomerase-like protein